MQSFPHNICGDLGHPHDPLVGLRGFNSVSPAAVCTATVYMDSNKTRVL